MKKVIILFILVYVVVFPVTALAQTSETEAGLTPDSLFYWFDRLAERVTLIFTFDSQDKVEALSKFGLERLAEAREINDSALIGSLISEYLTGQREIEQNSGKDLDSLVSLSEDQIEALIHLSVIAANSDGEVNNMAAVAIMSVVEKLKEKRLKISQMNITGNPQATSKAIVILDKIARKLADPTAIPSKDITGSKEKETEEEKAENVKAATSKHTEVLENNAEKIPEQAKPAIEKATQAVSKPKPNNDPSGQGSPPPDKRKKK